MTGANESPRPGVVVAALAADVSLVAAFAAIGRASHDENVLGGLWTTAWPFLAGLAVGWLISRGWLAPLSPLRTGVPVWAITVVAAMLLRSISDQGTAPAFIVVASITLLVFLVGWRGAAWLVARRRRARTVG